MTGSESLFRSRRRALRLRTIQGVLDLMQTVGTLDQATDAICPNGNGYSMWFYDPNGLGTAPLSADEILRRIEAREA